VYVFDTCSISQIAKFYPKRFPTLWHLFTNLVNTQKVISVQEVYKEFKTNEETVREWAERYKAMFIPPSVEEALFIKKIFSVKNGHFQQLVGPTKVSIGQPCADPFVIASAKIKNATVVTEEKFSENSSKIPTICKYFTVDCTNLEGFMERENWKF
jgi:hypothetical protein